MPTARLLAGLAVLLLAAASRAATLPSNEGPVEVRNWGYFLQGPGGGPLDVAALAAAPHDLVVTDFSRDGTEAGRFTFDEVCAIQDGRGRRKVVAAYLSIGEAEQFRTYWNPAWTTTGTAAGKLTAAAPSFLGPTNPDWPESRKVRYWEPAWRDVLTNRDRSGYLDHVVQQGFDAAYLDIVDAYYFWAAEARASDKRPGDPKTERDAARRMLRFIVDLTASARLANDRFYVIPQNGEFVLDDADLTTPDDLKLRAAFLDAVGAIGVEDVYFRGDADEDNPFDPEAERIPVLQRDFLGNGKPVFAVEYLSDPDKVSKFYDTAAGDGFIPYAASSRGLTVVQQGVAPRVPEPAGGAGLVGLWALRRRRRR